MAERLQEATPEVVLTLADGARHAQTGSLTVAEPNVNEQTGVVTLRMEFPNPDGLLLPGMYVQVAMPQGVARGVVLAPMEGVAYDRRGRPTALVVGEGDMVEERTLEVIGARDGDWIVRAGLSPGDRIIVSGLQKARPGATVIPQERGAPPPDQAAAAGAPAAP
jgi:membrane fusion protein (multidrug efflux system)